MLYRTGKIILATCIVWGVLLCSVCLGADVSADNRGPVLEFQLLNNSGKTIREVWLIPSGSNYFTALRKLFIRGGNPLRSGRYMTISVDLNPRYWDMRVDFRGGGKKEWHEIDMWSGIRQLEITQSLQLRYQR